MSIKVIEKAREFASQGFKSINHFRKYSGEPYEVHTDEVAWIVSRVDNDPNLIAAAHLHDTAEDVNIHPYTLEGIAAIFGPVIEQHVDDLTEKYTKEEYPEMNRKERKTHECFRISHISPGSKTIKLADLISNTRDIVKNDPKFAVTYLKEKRDLLPHLKEGNPILFAKAQQILNDGLKQLGIQIKP